MTKVTRLKRLRGFDLDKNIKGEQILVPRDTIHPPFPRTKRIVKCGIYEVAVMVSIGQILNERKVCKRFLAEINKLDNSRKK